MKYVLNYGCLATLLLMTTRCITSRYQPIQRPTGAIMPMDLATVTVFLLERDLPPAMERLGTVALRTNQANQTGIHQQIENELQRVGREKGANGACRIQHGTHDNLGIITYLLFRYPK